MFESFERLLKIPEEKNSFLDAAVKLYTENENYTHTNKKIKKKTHKHTQTHRDNFIKRLLL